MRGVSQTMRRARPSRPFLTVALVVAALTAAAAAAPKPAGGARSPFHPRDARVWDKSSHTFVWREACGNSMDDHRLAGGFEWERDSRNFIALGHGSVRDRRRGGLFMLSFPDGDVLSAEWKVNWPKGHVWRIRYALTDSAAAHSTNGLKFTVTATDGSGKRHTLIERVLKPRDEQVYDESIRFPFAAKAITFIHDNLGKEVWDVLWIHPDGLVVPPPGAVRRGPEPPSKPVPEPVLSEASLAALRAAVEDLCGTFPSRYPRGREFLARIDRIRERVAEAKPDAVASEFVALRREALVANPLVSGRPIVFVVRRQYRSSFHAIDTLFHTGEQNTARFEGGGAMKTIDLATGVVTTLVDVPEGVARDPDVHFDGKRIVFAMRRHIGEDYHIWEINTDGSGLVQLTFAEGVSDFDPIYLPGGDIVFSSTREPKYNMCSRDIAANLFRMTPDGANIHQITKNTLFDNHAELLPDGRILYARWEYVDRNFGDAHSLWTVGQDGTNQAIFWGNNTASPGAVFNAHVIPGTHRILCVLGPHHDRLWGALGIIDPIRGMDGRGPILRTWPAEAINLARAGGPFDCDIYARVRTKYEDPWPLSAKHFLCSRMTGVGEQMGITLIDVFGNEALLHAEGPGCYDPMPVGPRPRPPVIPPRRDFSGAPGLLYVMDVYQGTHMRGVERGSVKRLRVVESPEKRFWSPGSWNGQGYTAPGMNWHSLENKRILGTVPVEEDGSAYFVVPAERFVYFQLLDADGMMIQSMRSGTVLQPGERTGCVGCHEDRLTAPPNHQSLAMLRPPRTIEPWYGAPRLFSYMAEVQPVFNRHCLKCHDYGKKGAHKLILAPDRTICFNASYNELWRKKYVRCVGGGPAPVQQAYSWGSHASKLIQTLRKGHNDVRLSREDLDRLVTWVDLNAPYYAHYACAYPNSLTGRCPLDGGQLRRLTELTGVPFAKLRGHGANRGPQVSFNRPKVSPALAAFKDKSDPKYAEALAIIRSGQEMLRKRPRADMPGFVPCETDQRRQAKYVARRRIEADNRQAIRGGTKRYDDRPTPPAGTANGE